MAVKSIALYAYIAIIRECVDKYSSRSRCHAYVCVYSQCQNAMFECADAQCPANIKCPGDFVYRTNLKLCGNTCSDYMSVCQANDYIAEGCTCPEGYVEAAGVGGV